MEVGIMLVGIEVNLFGATLEDGIRSINLGYNMIFCPLEDFGLIIHGLFYGLIQKVGCHGHLRAMAFGAFGVNVPLK